MDAVRAGDESGARALTTADATIDEAFLAEVVTRSAGAEEVSGVFIGFAGDSCVRLRLRPGGAQLMLGLVRVDDEWRIKRASNRDAECEDHVD